MDKPWKATLFERRASTAAASCTGPTAPGQHPRALVVNHLGVTLGAAPRATLSAPTPSTPPLWAAASLRRSARCPFSPFSWDCIERVVTPVFTLPPSSRSSRNVRESKFTVRRTSRTPPSLPPPSSIPNLFIYHSKNHQSTAHTHILPAGLQPEDLLLPVPAERSRLLDHIPCRNHAGERVDARRPLQLRRLRQDGVGVRLILRPAGLGD